MIIDWITGEYVKEAVDAWGGKIKNCDVKLSTSARNVIGYQLRQPIYNINNRIEVLDCITTDLCNQQDIRDVEKEILHYYIECLADSMRYLIIRSKGHRKEEYELLKDFVETVNSARQHLLMKGDIRTYFEKKRAEIIEEQEVINEC